MRQRWLLKILGGVLASTLALVLLVLWMTRPQTKLAAGFSEAAFRAIQPGQPEADVIHNLGEPLARFSEETPEEWCFAELRGGNDRATGNWFGRLVGVPPEAKCLYLKEGSVVGVRLDRLDSFKGKTAEDVLRQLGNPKYIVPEGKKVLLRYSEPQQPTNSYEVFLVILDRTGAVRGTQHYLYPE